MPETLKFAGFEVVLDPNNLRFSEATLTEYIQSEAGYYDNFGAYLAIAERHLQNTDTRHEQLYAERFVEAKEMGGSDKLAEAKAKADPDVVSLKEKIADARYVVNRLKQHLKAWDKNHDNAQSLGHMLRKSMDKLNAEIMSRAYGPDSGTPGLDREIEATVTHYDESSDQDDSGFESDLTADNLF